MRGDGALGFFFLCSRSVRDVAGSPPQSGRIFCACACDVYLYFIILFAFRRLAAASQKIFRALHPTLPPKTRLSIIRLYLSGVNIFGGDKILKRINVYSIRLEKTIILKYI